MISGRLSRRELVVLRLVAEGQTNVEIARSLDLSAETVKTHVRHVLWKLEARSRTHAVTVGFRRHLIS